MTNTWWTPEEMKCLSSLMEKGEKSPYIAEVMRKPIVSVRHKMRWLKLSAADRTERYRHAKARRLERVEFKSVFADRRPTSEMIAKRDEAYYGQPRSITALLLGDPPAGRSALEQRS